MLLLADAQPVPAMFTRAPPCRSATAPIDEPCELPLAIGGDEALHRIGARDHVWWLDGDRLTMIARPTVEPWVLLCCSVQTALDPIKDSGLAAITVRVPRLREAILDVRPWPTRDDVPDIVRGPDAPPAPERLTPPVSRLIHKPLASIWLGETRNITIYLPPSRHPGERLPVFYFADNLAAKFAPILEAAVRHGRSRAAILVGIDAARPLRENCRAMNCDRRGLEYKLDMNEGDASRATPFGKHLRFVTDEVIPYVEQHYAAATDRNRRVIGGSSNGGHWALSAAGLRPDLFGNVMAFSSSGRAGTELGRHLKDVRLYGGAGVFEPDYLANTMDAVVSAKAAGATTRARTLVAGHGQLAWDIMFAEAEPWLLETPRKPY